jgi:hypothetical protein
VISFLSLLIITAFADQVEMQNGDRYNGKIVSMTNDVMVLQSEILGTVTIPRGKVARMALGTNVPARSSETGAAHARAASPGTNSPSAAVAALRQAGVPAGEAEKVKQQFLADADPAAKAKYDQMLNDLISGKMSAGDLRVQAKSAADQLRALKRELGPESDATLDSYLSILESFLNQVPATEAASVKSPAIGRTLPEKEE